MTKEKIKGHLAILTAFIIFGLNIPITKSVMNEGMVSSYGITYMRMFVAAIVFWVVSFFYPREHVNRKDMIVLFLGGLFGVVLNQGSFVVGLEFTTPIDAALVATLAPVLVMLLSAMYLKEPITWKKTMGVVLGAAGAILIIVSGTLKVTEGSNNSWIGGLLCFLASLSYAIYLVITKPIIKRYSTVTLMKWMFLYAALLCLPLGAGEVLQAKAFTAEAGFSVILRLLYITLLATCVAYLLIPVALKRLRPTTVSMYNYIQPLVAAVAAIILGQDTMGWQKPVAAVLIFSGVYLVMKSKSREDVEREKGIQPPAGQTPLKD